MSDNKEEPTSSNQQEEEQSAGTHQLTGESSKGTEKQSPPESSMPSMFNEAWLRMRGTGELRAMWMQVNNEWDRRKRVQKTAGSQEPETKRVAVREAPPARSTTKVTLKSEIFERHPASVTDPDPANTWQVALIDLRGRSDPVLIELVGEAILGRGKGEGKVDIDLTGFGAEEFGISREHARLIPRPEGIFVTDLGSRNGTFCDGKPVKPGMVVGVKSDGVIALGAMFVQVKVITTPDEEQSQEST